MTPPAPEPQEPIVPAHKYNIVRECDVICGFNCLRFSHRVPFQAVLACVEEKCNCRFEEAENSEAVMLRAASLEEASVNEQMQVSGNFLGFMVRLLFVALLMCVTIFAYTRLPKPDHAVDFEDHFLESPPEGYQRL